MAWTGTPISSTVAGDYITDTDLDNYGVDTSSVSDDHLALIIADVEAAIDKYTGDSFKLHSDVTRYFDGDGKDKLYFAPVTLLRAVSITSVDFWNMVTSSVTTSLIENTDYRLADSGDYLQRTDGGVWTKGTMNIRVIGDWGWSTCPEPIRWCAALMVAQKIDPNFKGLYVDSALSWPHLSIKREVSGKRISPITGIPSIDKILWSYRRFHSMMSVP